MRKNFGASVRAVTLAGVATLALLPATAFAQDAEDGDDGERTIVVTGTLIRGVEATGSQSIDLDAEAIAESGASTANELLNEIPQVAGFNSRFDNDPRAADRLQVSRPVLRGLPGNGSATGATTLILVDGHRMTPMGVDQASFDPDFIATGAIERVEVITDGGSSLYGADAVGGVINFITLRSYDGVEVHGGYDFGDNYSAWNAGFTAGTAWDGGSAFVSYSTYQREDVLNNDRSYAERGSWNAAGTVLSPSGTQCFTPVGEVSTYVYFAPFNVWSTNSQLGGSVVPVGSPCDIDGESSLLPELERHSVLAGFSQELSDSITLDVKANFGDSAVRYSAFPLGDTISQPAPTGVGTPFERRIVSAVGFSYGPNSAYVDRDQALDLRVYGISPELTIDLGSDWQLRNTMHWGRSENTRSLPTSDRNKLLAYVGTGAVNVNNIAAASATVIQDILNYESAGEAIQELFLVRAVADGGLFDLGDDTVRVAIGAEFNNDSVKLRSDSVVVGGLDALPFRTANRDVRSVFGELSIPLFSVLDVSLSGRYDDYSDFGDTFNSNIGVNLTPFDGLRLFGHWGESFNAPTALDTVRTANSRFIANAAAGVPDPNGELAGRTNNDVLLVEGSGGSLQPQTAETWSFGGELEPIDNLVFSANYYDINFQNLLSSVNPQSSAEVLAFPDKFIFNPTQTEFDAFLAASSNGAQFADINAADVGVIIDRRVANLGQARLKGLDFAANYSFDTSFGEASLGLSGSHTLTFNNITVNGTTDQLANDLSDLRIAFNAGLTSGGFSSRVTVRYSNGFSTNIGVNQTHVGSFTVADLFLGYEFPEDSGIANGLAVRLNVENLFDQEPPVWRQQRNLNFSGFTLGRIFKLSVSREF